MEHLCNVYDTFSSMEALCGELPTPCALVDLAVVQRNIARLNERLARHGDAVRFRPHVKTHKNADLARMQVHGHFGGISVSTLAEAKHMFAQGFHDITYAVGMVGKKVKVIASEVSSGLRLTVVVDSEAAAQSVAKECEKHDISLAVLIEIDSGHHRCGLQPASEQLIALARCIHDSAALRLEGVLTHGGHSYGVSSTDDLQRVSRQERDAAVCAAERLRAAGFPCDVVSIGSTPSAFYLEDATGVTEIRAGVYLFHDLDQLGIGSCEGMSDIALTVLTSVISHQPATEKFIVDAGGLALSKDISAHQHESRMGTIGYGVVKDRSHLYVAAVSQEHGHVRSSVDPLDVAEFPIGSVLRIVPNHACFTAAAYEFLVAFEAASDGTVRVWKLPRVNGW